MRISFVLPPLSLSGGIKVVAIHAKALAQKGHTVRLISVPRGSIPTSNKVKSLLQGKGWPAALLPSPSHLDGTELDHRVLDRRRPVTDADVPDGDVVVATWWETAEWVAALSPSKGAKAYFIQGHEVFDHLPLDRVRATWRLPLQKITISKWLVELAAREYGVPDVWLVPNGVDTDQFHASPRGRQERPTVGLLYATAKCKGVDVSLNAILRAALKMPDIRVVAFGAEHPSSKLPLPAGTAFHYKPPQNLIRDIYAACDVWLCGSYSEGFHLPPLEAMACRCPVVSTRVGGPMDTIECGRNGYVVPVGDCRALADRLVDVLSMDGAGWGAMSDAALATSHRYSWDDATRLMETALEACASMSAERYAHSI